MQFSLAAQQMQAHIMQLPRMCTPVHHVRLCTPCGVNSCACICLAVSCGGCCLQGCSSCKQSKACCACSALLFEACIMYVNNCTASKALSVLPQHEYQSVQTNEITRGSNSLLLHPCLPMALLYMQHMCVLGMPSAKPDKQLACNPARGMSSVCIMQMNGSWGGGLRACTMQTPHSTAAVVWAASRVLVG